MNKTTDLEHIVAIWYVIAFLVLSFFGFGILIGFVVGTAHANDLSQLDSNEYKCILEITTKNPPTRVCIKPSGDVDISGPLNVVTRDFWKILATEYPAVCPVPLRLHGD